MPQQTPVDGLSLVSFKSLDPRIGPGAVQRGSGEYTPVDGHLNEV
jgi:hypothetical protein